MAHASQSLLRLDIQAKRQALPLAACRDYSDSIVGKILSLAEIKHAQTIAAYLNTAHEVDLSALFEPLWRQGKTVVIPRCVIKADIPTLHFYQYLPGMPLINNQFDIREPDPNTATEIPIESIDIALTPIVAFDRKGHRIGMGGGYYDRTFADINCRPLMIGCAFALQYIDTLIDIQPWDIAMDAVVTEIQTLWF